MPALMLADSVPGRAVILSNACPMNAARRSVVG